MCKQSNTSGEFDKFLLRDFRVDLLFFCGERNSETFYVLLYDRGVNPFAPGCLLSSCGRYCVNGH